MGSTRTASTGRSIRAAKNLSAGRRGPGLGTWGCFELEVSGCRPGGRSGLGCRRCRRARPWSPGPWRRLLGEAHAEAAQSLAALEEAQTLGRAGRKQTRGGIRTRASGLATVAAAERLAGEARRNYERTGSRDRAAGRAGHRSGYQPGNALDISPVSWILRWLDGSGGSSRPSRRCIRTSTCSVRRCRPDGERALGPGLPGEGPPRRPRDPRDHRPRPLRPAVLAEMVVPPRPTQRERRPARLLDTRAQNRQVSHFGLAGQAATGEPAPAGRPACSVGLAQAWWTIGFEAAGPARTLHAVLQASAALVFDQAPRGRVEVSPDNSSFYPH